MKKKKKNLLPIWNSIRKCIKANILSFILRHHNPVRVVMATQRQTLLLTCVRRQVDVRTEGLLLVSFHSELNHIFNLHLIRGVNHKLVVLRRTHRNAPVTGLNMETLLLVVYCSLCSAPTWKSDGVPLVRRTPWTL